jgi:hypothetical protein
LHTQILGLSQGLWQLSSRIDEILLKDTEILKSGVDRIDEEVEAELRNYRQPEPMPPYEPVEVSHTTPETMVVRGKSRFHKESHPEPPQTPVKADVSQPIAEPVPKKQGIMERLLGKDADEKAKLRNERRIKLEQELAELSKK